MPAPPSKRARTSSITVEQVNAEMVTPPTRKLKQHETLWFEDGNIVLATDVHLYSVHRGVLAKNSTVFKDMLDLPNVGGASNAEAEGVGNGDSWEGKPLVRMVGDSDEDISNILMALYDVKFYSAHKPTTLPILLSLIRMSTKYNFSDIRDEVTRHLQRCYPSDLSSMERRNFDDLFVDHENEAEDYDLQLLAVAQQCDMKTILPMLYFDCAASDLDLILEASESLNIPKDCFKRILRGHVMLIEYAHQKGILAFATHQRCTLTCSTAKSALLVKYVDNYSSPGSITLMLEGKELEGDKKLRASVCKDCLKISAQTLEDFGSRIWDTIPDMFDLGNWENLKSG